MSLKPICLFSDSQLLFWQENGSLFLHSLTSLLESNSPKAAYIGASNGDDPVYYGLFEASMQAIGVRDCKMIMSEFSEPDASFLDQADIILLSGGDVARGWRVFQENGLNAAIPRRYYEGALLIGVSAGAVQLGWFGQSEADPTANKPIDMFKLVPFIIGAHGEKEGWAELKQTVKQAGGIVPGIGIPTGGGAIYYADQTLEPVRHPIDEFSIKDDQLTHNIILGSGPDIVYDERKFV